MGINMMQLQDVMDKSSLAQLGLLAGEMWCGHGCISGIYMIREIMKGIRIVKCYAWEAAMEAIARFW